ncbi:hypothetical protein [Cupriavidus taiwanensis]|uniref:hypothetical protein n=1 Tax=Cupriavidus taiwanensis TaxID=164546 RepID=UPI0039C2DCAF
MEANSTVEVKNEGVPRECMPWNYVSWGWHFITHKIKDILLEKSKPIMNMAWYIFIIVIVGQIGPLIQYAKALWGGHSVWGEIRSSAAKGELLTCAIAILAAATFFLIKEYNSPDQIKNRAIKSFMLLWTIVCGLGCALISVQLLSSQKFASDLQSMLHWIFYSAAMVTAFLLWMLEEWQTTAAEEMRKLDRQAISMIDSSKRTKTSTGVKV